MALTIGIVGCGDIFPVHVRGWNSAGNCSISAIFDADPAAMKRASERFGLKSASSLEQLIEGCDVVDICTPPDSHTAIAEAGLKKRRHLFIEKPVVLTSADWELLVHQARDAEAKICAGFSQKFLPQVQLAKKWVDEGRIGHVIRVRTEQFLTPQDDWMLRDAHHWAHTLTGGRWAETLPHDIYLIRLFAGPVEVSGASALHGTGAAPSGNADEVVVSLRGPTCLAQVHYSANCDRNQRNIVITGSRGTIEITGGLVATLSTLFQSRWKHEIGMPFLQAGQTLAQLVPNRVRWWRNRLRRQPPHSRLIASGARFFEGAGPSPTELDEIGNVVQCCEVAGRQLGRRPSATTSAPRAARAASVASDDRVPSEDPRVAR
jgi:predicted dehydrogenase